MSDSGQSVSGHAGRSLAGDAPRTIARSLTTLFGELAYWDQSYLKGATTQPDWFLCENVPAAPRPEVAGYIVRDVLVNNRDDCGGEQNRERRFSFGTRDGRTLVLEWPLPPVPMAWESTVCSASAGRRASGPKIDANGRRQAARLVNRPLARELELQGLPPDFLEDAPFTVDGKRQAIGNGVPVGMGRMIARAVRRALGLPIASAESEAA